MLVLEYFYALETDKLSLNAAIPSFRTHLNPSLEHQ
jgi:hypothetical protein